MTASDIYDKVYNATKGLDYKVDKEQLEIIYSEASDLIRAAIKATGANDNQVSAAMYYAYESGHSGGYEEVFNKELVMLNIFEGH